MAVFAVDFATHNSCEWIVAGLSNYWTTQYYTRVVIATDWTNQGSSIPPDGIVATAYPPSSGTRDYVEGTIYNLNSNTNYTFYAFTQDRANGYYWVVGMATIKTLPPPVPATPSPPYLLSESYRYEGGFRVDWNSVSGATSYTLSIKPVGGTITTYTTTSTYHNFYSGSLSYGTSYELRVRANNSSGSSAYSGATIITTRPKKPTISAEKTGTSLIVYTSNVYNNYTGILVYLRNSLGNVIDYKVVYTSGNAAVFANLTPNTNYYVDAMTYYEINNTTLYSDYTSRILIKFDRPTNWTWTTTELSAFSNNGVTTTLTYLRWNAFIDKINEFRTYKGLSSIGGKMTSIDKDLTAIIFRTVAQGIRDMTSNLDPSLTYVQKNDIVYGNFFVHMADAITHIT